MKRYLHIIAALLVFVTLNMTSFAQEEWTDVLAMIELPRDYRSGVWMLNEGVLVGGSQSALETTYILPLEYDIIFEFDSESTAINLLLASPIGVRFEWMQKGWSHVICAIKDIGQTYANLNETATYYPMENNVRYISEVRVRTNRFTALVNSQVILDYPTSWTNVAICDPWHSVNLEQRTLGLWFYKHTTRVHQLKVREHISTDDIELKIYPAVEFEWQSQLGKTYHIQYSTNLASDGWLNFGQPINGNGSIVSSFASTRDNSGSYYRLLHYDTPPNGMAYISSGSFVMGVATNMGLDGGADSGPQHSVYLDGFFIDKYEVTKALWDEVYLYSTTNGYEYSYPDVGQGKGPNHPAVYMNWNDAVKWCNARSEQEGLVPVYYTNDSLTVIYKTGTLAPYANWGANGYRLPTEAEWEKAARGDSFYSRYHWGNTITHSNANYRSNHYWGYDVNPLEGYHPAFTNGAHPYTSPVGSFLPNSYGLYDMSGNVEEMCWDWHQYDYYSISPINNPKGPDTPTGLRQFRGGSYHSSPDKVRVDSRNFDGDNPSYLRETRGFRCVRNLD